MPCGSPACRSTPLLTQSGRGLTHVTLGISLRDVAGDLPLTARGVTAGGAAIQQTTKER